MDFTSSQRIDLRDGGMLQIIKEWLRPSESAHAFDQLLAEVPWVQEHIMMGARRVLQPRLSAWIGDGNAVYRYSGRTFSPVPWTVTTARLRDRIAEAGGPRFNSVLANLYRNGSDSMGAHADNEPELGPDPVIASLSLGATRRFVMHHRNKSVDKVEVALTDGMMLWITGTTQRFWRHQVPKTRREVGQRINLTFRTIGDIAASD
jgi:alkylated DNA repair dioxygenase AlkB